MRTIAAIVIMTLAAISLAMVVPRPVQPEPTYRIAGPAQEETPAATERSGGGTPSSRIVLHCD